ncbi:phosphoenolpyruvate carboxykinase (GTP) [Microbacterium amylolyticum]|uniref:Phosphoenolpyruvate carboxykinase [GTP] n=1 Tax=Microbacterium amylolyticum TaxID=936337 RepID=A0ABS4ZIR4_9MICO|nr:phosphoenolpyruvate carboxykinase (GTP) [Microbacterium amylolyticum]MBP2437173.1 phosphoenolpyruvate carboxykinase (GTP) [Microbacterium amylolyticum]
MAIAEPQAVTRPSRLREFGDMPRFTGDAFQELVAWVQEIADLTKPDRIHWVDGSADENAALLEDMVEQGTLIPLDEERRPNSYLARSDAGDVARLESRTFISSEREEDAGPTNNWVPPQQMKSVLTSLFDGAMRGRTMFVVPFSMGKIGGPISQLGVQITDSPYAVASIGIMTRVGTEVTRLIAGGTPWVRTVHSVGHPLTPGEHDVSWPSNEEKYIAHFPDTLEVWSFGSGYGGNAILAKKCFALRIASVLGRDQGWMAEHMLLIRVISPEGRRFHIAAAFPSACGKTNLAMLRPTIPGWRVETLGDDIVWIRPGEDGRLHAINPEAGFFGVAPGTGASTNVTAVEALHGNVIFTNVALTDDGDVWWEGLTDDPPAHLTDWQGEDWTPDSGRPAAHPNSRFTVDATQAPSISPDWEEDVPLDAILFGGRRATNVPLVAEAFHWNHGVFMGATISSERTAAAEGVVGELRRDPFAMMPFCGYNMADYFGHWIEMGQTVPQPPAIFQVNWFRKGEDGRFLWPGFGENSRVIEWICRRLDGEAGAFPSPVGLLPTPGSLNRDGIDVPAGDMVELFDVDAASWLAEADLTEEFFDSFGEKIPQELREQLRALRARLETARG